MRAASGVATARVRVARPSLVLKKIALRATVFKSLRQMKGYQRL
jgi:hypothetical protein